MRPQPTWFFKDGAGKVFAVNEKEAFEILTNRSQWRRHDLTMVGQSDGQTYYQMINEAGPKGREIEAKIKEKRQNLDKLIKGHDRLIFEEFYEEDDPKVQRAKAMIAKAEEELAPMEEELKSLRSGLVQKAFDAELEKATGNMVNPRDFSVVSKVGNNPQHQAVMNNFVQSKRVI